MALLDYFRMLPLKVRIPLFVVGNVGGLILMGQGVATPLVIVASIAGAALLLGAWFLLTLRGRPVKNVAVDLNRQRLDEVLTRLAHFESPGLLTEAGSLLMRMGKPKEAQPHLERALAHNPNEIDAHYALGCIHADAGRHDKAWPHFSRVFEADPDHDFGQIRLRVAEAYLELNEPDHASMLAETYLKRQPGDPAGLIAMGRATGALGHASKARELLDQAIDVAQRLPAFRQEDAKRYIKQARRAISKLPAG